MLKAVSEPIRTTERRTVNVSVARMALVERWVRGETWILY